MKRILFITFFACLQLWATAQVTIRGKIIEQDTWNPVEGATITIGSQHSISNENGDFQIEVLRETDKLIEISSVSHLPFRDSLKNYHADFDPEKPIVISNLTIHLKRKDLFLQPVEILGIRANQQAPFTKTDFSKKEIEKTNLGQDLPFLLNQVPSTVINSDAGNGVGYTGIRIRGSDLSRINVTLNGIPYNDAESQGVFFVDLPDFASSVNSIQVQRGVGTSSNGAGAFGATINIGSNEFNEKAYAELNNAYGSFNTWKHTAKAGTGLINDHLSFDARLSKISSSGYMDRAFSDLKSFYVTGAYYSRNTQVRMNVFGGEEKTYQAWYGVPENLLKTNRTYNPAGTEKTGEPYDNETDNYRQDHYQFFVNHSFNPGLALNLAFFLTRGRGYYEQYKAHAGFLEYGVADPVIGGDTITSTDLVRQLWLDNDYYGNIFSLQYNQGSTRLSLGGGWNQYNGNHFGKVIWSMIGFPKDFKWYQLGALKTDFNLYGKWQQQLAEHWESFADLQYRRVAYKLNGFRNNPGLKVKNNYDFLNPKIGLNYLNQNWRAYLSYALANKEPNRDDFEASPNEQPRHETLHDIEAGLEKRSSLFSWGTTLYYMRYHNQLVLTGKINDVGAYTRTNIPESYRLGLELQASYRPIRQLRWDVNVAASQNKIMNFSEYVDDYDNGDQKINTYKKTDISFSPDLIAGSTVSYLPVQNLELSLLSKYVGSQYLDNTSNSSRRLDAYFVNDLRLIWTIRNKLFREIILNAQLNNVFNVKYEPNGYTFSYIYGGEFTTENYYYPMAGTNFMAGISLKF